MLFSGAKVQLFRGKQNFSQLFQHFLPPPPLSQDKICDDGYLFFRQSNHKKVARPNFEFHFAYLCRVLN